MPAVLSQGGAASTTSLSTSTCSQSTQGHSPASPTVRWPSQRAKMPWMIAPVETMVGTRMRGSSLSRAAELRVVERGAAPEPDHELDAVGEPAAQLLLVAQVEPLSVDNS